jgi:hypothetical protein
LSACEGSKGARDFHFDLHHPEVLFGQVVGEGHVEIGEEAQGFGLEGFQPLEQIVAGAVLDAPARFRRQFGQLAMEGKAEPNRRPEALDEGGPLIGGEGEAPALRALSIARLAASSMSRMSSAQGS